MPQIFFFVSILVTFRRVRKIKIRLVFIVEIRGIPIPSHCLDDKEFEVFLFMTFKYKNI